ncbi:MAG: precorrin-4 C(11)-methyltransferase [Prevotellaceae bacterium]|nr:precorrin-4 C(11)-methyltransferase [Prevotellaceae bacterium]MDY6130711.1 precorrin-4 C(11)-methyltransferase [Prevotella sp.]
MKTAIIILSKVSLEKASALQKEIKDSHLFSTSELPGTEHVESLQAFVDQQAAGFGALIFFSALGICVRSIKPLIGDKHTDPAVVCVDSLGNFAISVMSGHVGGANELARLVASTIGAQPVVTTQSDNSGLWALDTLAKKYGWEMPGGNQLNDIIFAFVNKEPTALLLDIRDEGTDFLESTLPEHVTRIENTDELKSGSFKLLIAVSPFVLDIPHGMLALQFVPRVFSVGLGLAHQAQPVAGIIDEIKAVMAENGLMQGIENYCSIDLKSDEPVVKALGEQGFATRFFTAEQLAEVEVPTPSDVVAKHVGTSSVSEASALLASNHGELLMTKKKGEKFTVAVAIDRKYLRHKGGHIEIVGAGPGDPDLVSVRGRKMLETADLILYAGSLVPRELTLCAKPGAVVRSSASMALEEQCAMMKEFYDKGKFVVRLHTGDPCIFGAIQEQMAFFDKHGMSYHITPGISSFLAAAAELRSQFTIPERVQTIILTRGEGRTPMPDLEKLHLLARSRSTMCIFLSAAIADEVQKELLREYPDTTPVAVCYHLTWKDQRIFRGQLKNLAQIVKDNHLTLTTMLVVGDAIDNRENLSKLYDRHFTHLFREGK